MLFRIFFRSKTENRRLKKELNKRDQARILIECQMLAGTCSLHLPVFGYVLIMRSRGTFYRKVAFFY